MNAVSLDANCVAIKTTVLLDSVMEMPTLVAAASCG